MNRLQCKHCNGPISEDDERCPQCGIPLMPGQHKASSRRFILFFILLVIFCLFMMIWLPPDWHRWVTR